MTINHWQSWTLFYVTKKGDIVCIRRTRLLTKKEMRSKSGRQRTSSMKIEKWKVVQKHKKLSWKFILFEREENAIYKQQKYNMRPRSHDQNKQIKHNQETAAGFLINLKNSRGFSFFIWLFQSYIYLCIFLLFYIVSSKACYYIKAHAFIWHYDTLYFISFAEQQSETVLEDSQIFIVITLHTTDQSCFLYLNFMTYISEIYANTFLPDTELWQVTTAFNFFLFWRISFFFRIGDI